MRRVGNLGFFHDFQTFHQTRCMLGRIFSEFFFRLILRHGQVKAPRPTHLTQNLLHVRVHEEFSALNDPDFVANVRKLRQNVA